MTVTVNHRQTALVKKALDLESGETGAFGHLLDARVTLRRVSQLHPLNLTLKVVSVVEAFYRAVVHLEEVDAVGIACPRGRATAGLSYRQLAMVALSRLVRDTFSAEEHQT